MKKIRALIIAAAAAAALMGCGKESLIERADAFDNPSRFRVEAGGSAVGIALVTDRETGVQYLMNTHTGTCTVLVDKEGRPWLANGWRDYE